MLHRITCNINLNTYHIISAEEFHFQDWITRNDIPKHVADCLIKEAITSKGDLLLLNRTNIGDLQLKLGEVNRVLAAVQTLRPGRLTMFIL